MKSYLIISALGPNQPEIVNELSRACTQSGCNVLNAKISVLGKDIHIALFISGNWGTIAKMEALLPSLEQRLGLTLTTQRTTEAKLQTKAMSYTMQVSAIDKMGILNGLSDFLYRLNIPIEEISAHTYTSHSGTPMAALNIKIHVPEEVHLASFREQFMSYCDDHNLDAFLEPARHQ